MFSIYIWPQIEDKKFLMKNSLIAAVFDDLGHLLELYVVGDKTKKFVVLIVVWVWMCYDITVW